MNGLRLNETRFRLLTLYTWHICYLWSACYIPNTIVDSVFGSSGRPSSWWDGYDRCQWIIILTLFIILINFVLFFLLLLVSCGCFFFCLKIFINHRINNSNREWEISTDFFLFKFLHFKRTDNVLVLSFVIFPFMSNRSLFSTLRRDL